MTKDNSCPPAVKFGVLLHGPALAPLSKFNVIQNASNSTKGGIISYISAEPQHL
jgi:hypothetical protein